MAQFVSKETTLRREKQRVPEGGSPQSYYCKGSAAAKLVQNRRRGTREGNSTEREEAAERPQAERPPQQRMPRRTLSRGKGSKGSGASLSGSLRNLAGSLRRAGSNSKLRPEQPAPPMKKKTSSVERLKESLAAQEVEQRERERNKLAADRLLKEWGSRTRGNVYEMMRSAHCFTDVFKGDPLEGTRLVEGDASSLKKCYHRLAARLHPDRQQGNPTATRVLAEEIFKELSIAFQKEASAIADKGMQRV